MRRFFFLICLFVPVLAYSAPVEISGMLFDLNSKTKEAKVARSSQNFYSGDVVIPESFVYDDIEYTVTTIVEKAFNWCDNLRSVSIPKSIKTIEFMAFDGCYNLEVKISDLAAWCKIDFAQSFYSGYSLSLNGEIINNLVIPEEITKIKSRNFEDCISIETVTIPNSVDSIDAAAFFNCKNLITVSLPTSLKYIGNSAFFWCEKLKKINIPFGIDKICGGLFGDCYELEEIELPNSIQIIESGAFSACLKLKSITIPEGVTEIGDGAFYKCGELTEIDIPNSLTLIGQRAFQYCTNLKTIKLGEKVAEIKSIAFADCTNLNEVYCYSEIIPNTYKDAFNQSYTEYATLYVPSDLMESYAKIKPWSNFKQILSLNGEEANKNKCELPSIEYKNGQLILSCPTEDVQFVTEITNSDIQKYYTSEISIAATYNISVYATKTNYETSDIVSATLCWIDAEPKTEGISNGITNVRATPVLIQSFGNVLSISGVNVGTPISVYDASGKLVGSTNAISESILINTNLNRGQIGILKIGEKTVKIIMK